MAYNPNNPNGAATAANSAPIAIATDQLSTLAKETGNLASVVTNTGRIPALGATTASASTPVAIATDQLSTLAKETGNLATVVTNTGRIPALGNTTMSASQPVTVASDQTPIATKDIFNSTTFSFTAAGSSTSLDASGTGYSYASVQITSQGTGSTVTFQTSNDGTNWLSQVLQNSVNTTSTAGSSSTTTGIWAGAIFGRYFRVTISGISAGTTAGLIVLTREPIMQLSLGTSTVQNGTWTMQPGNTANTTPWLINEQKSSTATQTNVTAAAASTTILALNTARKGMSIYNESTAILYLSYAATASLTAYMVQIPAGGFYEMPLKPIYLGLITGIWSAANGTARVLELT